MTNSRSPSDRTRAEKRQSALVALPAAGPRKRFRYWPAVAVATLVAIAVVGYLLYRPGPTAVSVETASAELTLCHRFMALRDVHDAVANELLGPAPAVPAEPVSPDEASRLHAEFFLHGDYQVASVQPQPGSTGGPDARFVLVLKGSVTSPRIAQTGPRGPDVINYSLIDPEVIVRVDGQTIRAVGWRAHRDANEKEPTEQEKKQFREALEEQQREQIRALQGGGRRASGK
jgi:hypothetical protein